jgi:hypothetical protein
MKDDEEPDFSAEVLGIRGDGLERLRRRSKQDSVDDRLVLVRNGGDRCRDREDDVEILGIEQVRLAGVDPRGTCERLAPGAVSISAGVEPHTCMTALVALLRVTAQRRRSAPLNCGHHTTLIDCPVSVEPAFKRYASP